jgi:hypothetical protein
LARRTKTIGSHPEFAWKFIRMIDTGKPVNGTPGGSTMVADIGAKGSGKNTSPAYDPASRSVH